MKKKKGLATLLLIIFISIIVLLINNSEKETKELKKEVVKNINMLTMMLETEAGTGNYQEVPQSEWPTDGYVFNETLSKCENGGTLSWDETTKKVIMKSNISDKCYIYFDKYIRVELNVSVNKDDSSITVTVTSTNEIIKYYYSKDDGNSYVENTSNTYTFNNLNNNTEYKIKIYGIDANGQKTQEYSEIIKTDYILLVNYIKNTVYTGDGVNGLYYHDGTGTYTNASQEAGDNSYRYSGANPNNYVCFGSDAATCPEDNLYRIIGLFDDDNDGIYNIKLIKNSRKAYAWDSGNDNTWSALEKPDIYSTLNTTYWTTLSNEWQNVIDKTHQWQVGGMNYSSTNTAKQYYDSEIKNQTGYEEIMPVGLMYLSDYGYAASPENWQTELYNYDNTTNTNNNWLYLGKNERTISRQSGDASNVFYVDRRGFVSSGIASNAFAVRPSIFLKSEIAFDGGTGSVEDPYRIS